MQHLDQIWVEAYNAVQTAVVSVLGIFLNLSAHFRYAFELIFALIMVYLVVIRLVPSLGSRGSDSVRKSGSKQSFEGSKNKYSSVGPRNKVS